MPLTFSATVDCNDASIELFFACFLVSRTVSQHRCAEVIVFLTMAPFPFLSGFYGCKS